MDCKDYFFRLLARREYSARELERKARAKDFDEEAIALALTYLQERNYQSDERTAESIITSCRGRYGRTVARRKCLEKGLDLELFNRLWDEQTAEANPSEELAALKAKAQRQYKIATFSQLDPKTKGKLANFLSYRGFNPWETIQRWQDEEVE